MLSQNEFLCDSDPIEAGYCNVNQTGEFILAPNATELSRNVLYTQAGKERFSYDQHTSLEKPEHTTPTAREAA